MESLLLPSKIDYHDGEKPNTGIFNIEPCYYGYGTTLGNALRRVLLSSLPGAAVTSLKIKGVQHEFSTVPHVKEDVLEMILNFKQLRLKVFSEDPVILMLNISGECKVTAKDIEKSADVEIITPDLHLATITDEKGELDIEITVARGRGYVPTESRGREKLDIGTLAIDSVFTPIVSVGFNVEAIRVGQITNYDQLVLTIETDGTLTPEDAFSQSVDVLLDHFNLLKDYKKTLAEEQSRVLDTTEILTEGGEVTRGESTDTGDKS